LESQEASLKVVSFHVDKMVASGALSAQKLAGGNGYIAI
jgi:hypothetical protein